MRRKLVRLLVTVSMALVVGAGVAGPAFADGLTVSAASGSTPVAGQRVGMCTTACGPMSPYNQGAGDPGTVVTFSVAP
jgi:hypothetical protein